MLWNTIYDFFVKHVFGGFSYDGGSFTMNQVFYIIGSNNDSSLAGGDKVVTLFGTTWTIGNYLSFIATLISIIIILVLMCLIVKKIFNIIFRLFTGQGVF